LPLFDKEGEKLDLLNMFDSSLTEPGTSREWKAFVKTDSGVLIPGRLCVVKKSKAAAENAKKKLLQKSRDHKEIKESTIRFGEFVILFSTFTEELFNLEEILDLYRWRWQIELAFKRLKSLINLGHLPKHNENSSQAWLYGKLFISLVIERLTQSLERLFFPWGNVRAKVLAK
jgi:IS4 transposase